jgi:hypothetical protein
MSRVYPGHPVSGGYKYGDLAFQVEGVSRIGTIEYGLEPRGTQTRAGLRWREPTATVNYRPVLSSERALQTNKPETCLKKISRRKKNWSRVPDRCLTPRRTGQLTVGRNVTLTFRIVR